MELTRRQLLKLSGLGLGGVLYAACTFDLKENNVESPTLIPEDLVNGIDTWYATLCRECGAAEGLIVRVMEGRAKKVEGNPAYPLNAGKHGARCEAGLQALYHPDRLAGPIKRGENARGNGKFEAATWTEGLDAFTGALKQQQSNAASVVIVTGSLRGPSANLVQQFTAGYGARHMVFESVEQTVLGEAIKRVYGDVPLPHFDIANAQYILSFGADFLGSWLNPVAYGRQYGEFRQGANRKRGVLVQVEPRFSTTAASADEWVPVNPGTEGLLALSIAYVIANERLGDANGLTALGGTAALQAYAPGVVATATGASVEKIQRIAHEFAVAKPGLALGGGSAAAHTNGVFNLSAIYALNTLVGNTGKAGGVIMNPRAPAGVEAVAQAAPMAQWQKLVDDMNSGRVQALIVRGADPLYGLPAKLGFEAALAKVPLVVSFSGLMDDTAMFADWVLPEHTGFEDWGADVPLPGPGYQVVGVQQPVVREFFESQRTNDRGTRGFNDVLLTVAEGVGGKIAQAVPWKTNRDLVMDSARKLFALNRGSLKETDFNAFWIKLLANGGWWDQNAKASAPAASAFKLPAQAQNPEFQTSADTPLFLMPFESSLGDGRAAHLPWMQAAPDPVTTATWRTWVEINLGLAREKGIEEGDVVRVTSQFGEIEVLAVPHPAIPRNVVAVPMGGGHRNYGRYAQDRGANVNAILGPATDKDTGAFAWAATKVRIEKIGRRIQLPKMEGTVPLPEQLEHQQAILFTKPKS
ncbi:MAG: 4Fe-4S ferredoxin [Dehalococcoidia bacterium]|nr:4Fe-4S ferredoxin [Dehalococcoidia bacterium]